MHVVLVPYMWTQERDYKQNKHQPEHNHLRKMSEDKGSIHPPVTHATPLDHNIHTFSILGGFSLLVSHWPVGKGTGGIMYSQKEQRT